MSSVFSSGMSLITSIELTANCLNNEYVTSQMDQVIDEIRTGGALSKAIEKTEIFPQMMITMLNVGEESGALDEILEKTSDFYDQEADDAIGKLVALMEPGMIVILGGVVGLVAVGLMAPIFGMYDNIG
jgi:type IV pilus assembly protein PilC